MDTAIRFEEYRHFGTISGRVGDLDETPPSLFVWGSSYEGFPRRLSGRSQSLPVHSSFGTIQGVVGKAVLEIHEAGARLTVGPIHVSCL